MNWLWLTVFLLAILAPGCAGLALFPTTVRPGFKTLGLVLIFGTGCVGYGLFILGLLGFTPTRWPLLLLSLVTLVFGGYAWLNRSINWNRAESTGPHEAPSRRRKLLSALVPLLLLSTSVFIVSAHALHFPLHEWDAFAIWGLKAKVVAAQSLLPKPDYFSDVSLSYSHLDYPLMLPYLMAGVYGLLGDANDQLGKACLPILYAGLVLVLFGFNKRHLSPALAVATTALVAASPIMLRWAGSGYADLPLAAFYLAAVVCLLDWHENGSWRPAFLCGIFSAFAAFTKNEGLVLAATNCFVMTALTVGNSWRPKIRGAVLCCLTCLALTLPWLFFSQSIPKTNENYVSQMTLAKVSENMERVPLIATTFMGQLWEIQQYGPIWLILLLAAGLGWRRFQDRGTIAAWLFLLVPVGVYAFIFLITPWQVELHLSVALDRLLLQVLPVAGVITSLHFAEVPDL